MLQRFVAIFQLFAVKMTSPFCDEFNTKVVFTSSSSTRMMKFIPMCLPRFVNNLTKCLFRGCFGFSVVFFFINFQRPMQKIAKHAFYTFLSQCMILHKKPDTAPHRDVSHHFRSCNLPLNMNYVVALCSIPHIEVISKMILQFFCIRLQFI